MANKKNTNATDAANSTATDGTEMTIGRNKYIVKSVCVGNNGKSLQQTLLNIAEKKAIREMGLA